MSATRQRPLCLVWKPRLASVKAQPRDFKRAGALGGELAACKTLTSARNIIQPGSPASCHLDGHDRHLPQTTMVVVISSKPVGHSRHHAAPPTGFDDLMNASIFGQHINVDGRKPRYPRMRVMSP